MNELDRKAIFAAQTENVRALEKTWNNIKKVINTAYSNSQDVNAKIFTKVLVQVYCAYTEAIFSKLIHTPAGLNLHEISQIKKIAKGDIVKGWKKCIELSVKKINSKQSNHIPNLKKKIFELIDCYIDNPRLIRNKIAHGQWEKALNTENTCVNLELTSKIDSLNIIELQRSKEAFRSLFRIVEDIIESPAKAHHKDYWIHIAEFEESQKKMSTWTLEDKISKLKTKKTFRPKFSGEDEDL